MDQTQVVLDTFVFLVNQKRFPKIRLPKILLLCQNLRRTMIVTDKQQLAVALSAFAWAHKLPEDWANATSEHLDEAGVSTMSDLVTSCRDRTLNLDLELFGLAEHQWAESTIGQMQAFLPGPVGIRCFKLAQLAANHVKAGIAETEYVHRPESGKRGKEQFSTKDWVLHVDCAGFVRNCLKHTTKNPFQMTLSDRDFMRAKDFFGFFQTLPLTVMDPEILPADDHQHTKWRLVPDLRMVIPGDVIVYRPLGNAAGGAAFTENDRKDIAHLLKAVKMAQLWNAREEVLCPKNVGRDPTLKPWVKAVQRKLSEIGIKTVKELKLQLPKLNELLRKNNFIALKEDTIQLMKECLETTALNTGHIVFCSGRIVPVGDNVYRVRIVHSTKHGILKNGTATTGVQEHYRRFTMLEDPNTGKVSWTREMVQAEPLEVDGDSDDNPDDDMEEDEEEDEEEGTDVFPQECEPGDELAGQAKVEVLAARMCF